ncbi:MAG TPA: hypothetical protein PLB31_06730 [Fimbriimonadaceae bacterium]|nr:hypothetical protein [Armatimonadota bacterium]HCM73483.1 hypothetical protein [Armatimonadota bacterium]HRD30079.1 hypothetical protein [Fimbriimonadaceae bacterium]HRE94369.1 hypothetical protein [Fimbriimonadaceae bacterium]HRI74151.1 hypothetical protein [Fimbriimonadaceae bacterium]
MEREKRQCEASWWVLYSLSLAGLVFVATDPILRPALLGSNGLLALIALIALAGILVFANVISLSVRELAVSMLGFAILGVIYFMSLRYWGSSAWPEGERKTYGEYPYKYIEALAFAAPFAVIAADCIFRVRWWLSTVTWLLSMWMTLVTIIVFWAD